MEQIQYITDDDGQRIGVLLDIDTFLGLTRIEQSDPERLVGLSQDELRALADSKMTTGDQLRLDELPSRQQEGKLGPAEEKELNVYLQQIDHLTLLKTRARDTLAKDASS